MASVETTQPLSASLPSPTRKQIGLIRLFAICLLIPCALVSLVLNLSPNFSDSPNQPSLREHPVGGDILQEYVGGHIWNADRTRLYDWKHSAALQHDVELVGFEWEASGYFPMVYPPFHYQFASFGSGLNYRSFVVAWMFAGAISLSIASFVFLSGYREIRSGTGGWFIVAILFTPLLLSLNMGQKSAILLAILTISFVLLHRERPFTAGLVFGLIAFKPYLAVPIGVAMLCKKQFRFVAGSLLTLSVLIVGSLFLAPDVWGDYVQMCFGMSNYISNSGYQLEHSHSLWGAMQLLLGDFNPALVKPMAIVAAIGLVTLLGRILSGPIELSSPRFAFQFAALVIATVLISPHFYTYDLTILLLPLAICGLSEEVSKHINLRLLYWICIAVLFGASIYVPLALKLGVQISTVVFFAWLIVIAGGWNAAKKQALHRFE
ncbi:glycosyltransferase family 87 protein [Mariniblastus fucicola]|uniref:Polyprenol-phosphate-mannose-dependent alpha-(1-2)-phosphatidylinositol mannoside mannosyltransferase n=1 Tax=Mariniblastus fucicola TaxID=980251 RepID=A0A5B9PCT0_9BACT|nr:glycosyltransferase family 87 protein [Mariniblastus fucicola]QEG24084.1 hypothetical protein MFFC18_40000 [Mariniblastus fucicola]